MKSITERVNETRGWIRHRINEIQGCSNEVDRRILYISLLDCFAQHYAEYQTWHVEEHFVDFIQKYGGKYVQDLLRICPVTMYYDYHEDLTSHGLHLCRGRLYTYESEVLANESERLKSCLPENKRDKATKKHRYVSLLYKHRSKLVHEGYAPGTPIDFQEGNEDAVPLVSSGTEFVNNQAKQVWTLYFPEKYIIAVLIETTNNYLEDCLNRNQPPFINAGRSRKSYYGWYD